MRLARVLFALYVLGHFIPVVNAQSRDGSSPDSASATTFAYYPGLRKIEVRIPEALAAKGDATASVCRQGDDRTMVINYWSDDPPISVNDPENNKWLLVTRRNDNALLLVLQTWNKADAAITVTLDSGRLGFRPEQKAWDVETAEEVPIAGETVQLTLPGPYGTRVLTIGARP